MRAIAAFIAAATTAVHRGVAAGDALLSVTEAFGSTGPNCVSMEQAGPIVTPGSPFGDVLVGGPSVRVYLYWTDAYSGVTFARGEDNWGYPDVGITAIAVVPRHPRFDKDVLVLAGGIIHEGACPDGYYVRPAVYANNITGYEVGSLWKWGPDARCAPGKCDAKVTAMVAAGAGKQEAYIATVCSCQ